MDEARARDVLADAGLGRGGAELLALGENAVFAAGSLVVKVGRDAELLDRARRELAVAHWLAEAGVPAVRAAEPEARLVAGHPVTVWHRLPEPIRPAEPRDLAELLRRVHALPTPAFALPRRELLGGVERWLRLAGDAIDPADAAYLRERRDGFTTAAAALTPHLPPGPIHGDALPRNVHVGPDGPVLVDLETFSADLREHDLVVMALSRDRYGLPAEAYDAFIDAYGWDVRGWDGCAVLRGARETASCAWVAQHAPSNPKAREEFERRVASLREGDATVRWYSF
ncbi:phosphotransferase enzyme family protein [Streptomyces sp. NBC_00286]|uniref:phosphotransferase enzyme family protein n=1 Tax=Streptomyces sp. NBC_00286 TaxID=2975701 RepID=UPI002E2A649D|nr:aminoglycoside phosphotransferase family protein [Streptomyces sp. NBC_00286]